MSRFFDHRFGYFFLFLNCPEREWRSLFVRVLLLISGASLFVVIIVLISSSCSSTIDGRRAEGLSALLLLNCLELCV